MRCSDIVGAVLVVLVAGAPDLLAHGGQYVAPAPTPPPPATATPSASGGATAGAIAAGARGGGGSVPLAGTTGATSQGRVSTGSASDSWELWWEHNQDAFLDLKRRLDAVVAETGGGGGALTGAGRSSAGRSRWRPTRWEVYNTLFPTLRQLLDASDDADVLDSAVLALARVSEETVAGMVIDAVSPLLAHDELSVQGSAALSLGVLGSGEAAPMLRDLVRDTSAGRRLVGRRKIKEQVRAFAALALGLLADADSVRSLMDVVKRLPDRDRDVKACAVVALGLIGAEHELAGEVGAFLEELLDERGLDAVIKSHVPSALGKLETAGAVPSLLATMGDRSEDNLVRQSAAAALGRLGALDDADVVPALVSEVRDGRQRLARHFALIALGRIGARGAEGPVAERNRAAIVDVLGEEISGRGANHAHRSWAALAAAIVGRSHHELRVPFADRIRAAYRDESDPSFQGAFALALGLLGDRTSVDDLLRDLRESDDDGFRGYAAVALGFLDARQSIDALRELCGSPASSPRLRVQAAVGLRLMRDLEVVPLLVERLEQSSTLSAQSSVARALGLVGDRYALDPLKALALDGSVPALTRAFACVALGLVGEKSEQPWHAALREDFNYTATTPSLAEVLSIL